MVIGFTAVDTPGPVGRCACSGSSLQELPYDPDTETWGLASLGALLTQFLRLFVLSTALGLAVGLASAALVR